MTKDISVLTVFTYLTVHLTSCLQASDVKLMANQTAEHDLLYQTRQKVQLKDIALTSITPGGAWARNLSDFWTEDDDFPVCSRLTSYPSQQFVKSVLH